MKLKEKLGFCGKKFHFRRSVATVEVNGITKDGERKLIKKQNLCKKCLEKAIDESTKRANKVEVEFEDDSKVIFESECE